MSLWWQVLLEQRLALEEEARGELHPENRMYMFESRSNTLTTALVDDYVNPSLFWEFYKTNKTLEERKRDNNPIFMYLGANASGTNFHRHSNAYNALLFGKKQWYLLPPPETTKIDRQVWVEDSDPMALFNRCSCCMHASL